MSRAGFGAGGSAGAVAGAVVEVDDDNDAGVAGSGSGTGNVVDSAGAPEPKVHLPARGAMHAAGRHN